VGPVGVPVGVLVVPAALRVAEQAVLESLA
jgi:hypothetical protein